MGAIKRSLQRAAVRVLWGKPTMRSAHAGASNGMFRQWWSRLLSADETLRYDLEDLRARSRGLVQSSGEAEGILDDFSTEVIGHGGIQLQVRTKNNRGRLVTEVNDAVEGAWRVWGVRGECTMDGRLSWTSLQRLIVRTMVMDGEFWAYRVRGAGAFGYRLAPFDADLVDHTHTTTLPTGNRVVMGVEMDAWSRPVAYHILSNHPSETGKRERKRVPAEDVLHVYRQLRPSQTRGVPWFTPVLLHFKAAEKYTEAELMASIVAAAQGGFFEQDDSAPDIDPPKDENGNVIPINMQAEPGLVRMLPKGVTFTAWSPTHPTTTVAGFMKVIKRMVARGLKRSYHSLTGDLESVNYSSLRTDRLRDMDVNRVIQSDIIEQVCQPVFVDWLTMARTAGRLPVAAPDTTILDALRWLGRGWDWVDPLKDAQGAAIDLALGATTRGRICANKGLDFYDVIDEQAEEIAYAKERDVPLAVGPSTYALVVGGVPDATTDPTTSPDTTTTNDAARSRLRRVS